MLILLAFAQLSLAQGQADSVYSSASLRVMVAQAAAANHEPPAELRGYQSHIETESSFLLRDTLGRERAAEIEQFATRATWEREGRYQLHVVGYRSQSVGVPYSTLSIVRAWTVPSLYGERLSLGAYFTRGRENDTLVAVHPFAADRDDYYEFSGGDTVAVLRVANRRIPIARIRVHPRLRGRTGLAVFDGEIDIDAQRMQIIRMRGQFVVVEQRPARAAIVARLTGLVPVAYIEFVNAEVAGKYWLPAFQRTEFQASIAIFGQTRPVFRIVSTISDIVVRDTGQAADSLIGQRITIDWAPSDTLNSYSAWNSSLGVQSGSVHADDFIDMAPDAWRTDGAPRIEPFPNSAARLFRFNRVEGLYLGLAPSVEFRSMAPGVTAGVYGGWAFTEQTARGGIFATDHTRDYITTVRAERALASTNDFTIPFGDDPGLGALLSSIDDYDYVDRRTATVSLTRVLGSVDEGLTTLQLGAGDDHAERARLAHGPIPGATPFLPNRGSDDGSYALQSATLEFHPNVTGDFVQPGVGARLRFEAGEGQLTWQRAELSLSARQYWGPVSLAAHADAGVVNGSPIPPQQLFEIGGNGTLDGYNYKQFAGDRAALFRGFATYRFPIWRRPWRIWRNYLVPGVGPGLALSAEGGWTQISSPNALFAVQKLGTNADGTPVSTATNGVRATVGAGLTFFSDLLHVGVARPVDHAAPVRLVVGFGAVF